QVPRRQSRRRGRSRTPRSLSTGSTEEPQEQSQPSLRGNRNKPRRGGRGGGENKGGLPAVDEAEALTGPVDNAFQTAGGAIDKAKGTVGQVTGRGDKGGGGGNQPQAPPPPASDGGKGDTLKLRLDLNLEVEIKVTAKLHGDLTLSLL
ncbi:hypothetical protein FIBSPDRAFT_699219, partial [Athelia psychrophila]